MNPFIPIDIPEGFEGPVETPRGGDYILCPDGVWKRAHCTSVLSAPGFFIRLKKVNPLDEVKRRLAALEVRLGFDCTNGMPPMYGPPPSVATSYYRQEIAYIKSLLEP